MLFTDANVHDCRMQGVMTSSKDPQPFLSSKSVAFLTYINCIVLSYSGMAFSIGPQRH